MKLSKLMSILGILAIVSVVTFIGCKKDSYEKIDSICPKVLFTDPSGGSTGVPLDQVVSVTFNEEMDPTTFTNQSFVVTGSVVAGTVQFSGRVATFTPASPLIKNHTYSGRITTAVKDLMGNALQQDYVWTFSTGDIVSPMLIKTDPYNLELGVSLNKVIKATFSELMNPASINDSSFSVKQGGNSIAGTVTYSDSVAYFTPSAPFTSNTVYTASITTKAKDMKGLPLESNYDWTFTTLIMTPPMVISTDPANLEIGVFINKTISADFNLQMGSMSLNTNTFTLKNGSTSVVGTVWSIGNSVYFKSTNNLSPGTTYTATITTGAKSMAGYPMSADYTWTFTTGTILAPSVVSTDPLNLATGVVLDKTVTATFSDPMDPLSITGSSFTLKQGSNTIAGQVSYSGVKASFNPTNDLLPGLKYTASITTAAKSTTNTPLANTYIWTFTTDNSTIPMVTLASPLNLETGVALNKMISATFNENMDPLTLTGSSFTLMQGSNSVTSLVTYSGKTAILNPSANLLPGTIYTATITTGAKNTNGNGLASNYVWTFTTGLVAAPKVLATDPIDKATNVALNKVISADFNEPMDAASLKASTFTLKQGTNVISGTIWYSGNTAFFKPNSGLTSGASYTASITTGAKNTSGVYLANNYTWTFSTKNPSGPTGPDLKSVGRFGIISGVGVSNNAGFSKINNLDVGIYPGTRSSITGFPPAVIVNGAMYASDDVSPPGVAAMLLQAKTDLTAAYLYAEGASSPAPATVSGDQGGKTLAPGIYKTTSTLSIQNGDLTLDAQGDPNAVWIFQIASAFTTVGGAGGNVILSGGAQAKNVYWQVGSSATLGGYTKFKGNILALTSITMGAYATATGRMLARNGAVVMTSTNIIDKP